MKSRSSITSMQLDTVFFRGIAPPRAGRAASGSGPAPAGKVRRLKQVKFAGIGSGGSDSSSAKADLRQPKAVKFAGIGGGPAAAHRRIDALLDAQALAGGIVPAPSGSSADAFRPADARTPRQRAADALLDRCAVAAGIAQPSR